MAEFDVSEGFGHVDRTAGTIFRYVLFGATMLGIVTLLVLLVLVTNDAIQPLSADPGWLLTFLVTLVLPTIACVTYLYVRHEMTALRVGVFTVGLLAVSLLFSGAIVMVFVDIVSPLTWVAYLTAAAVPVVALVGIRRQLNATAFTSWFPGIALVSYVSLFGLFGPIGGVLGLNPVVPSVVAVVQSIPVVPEGWLLVAATVGGGIAAVVTRYVGRHLDRRTGLIVGGCALATVLGVGLFGSVSRVGALPVTIVTAVALVPTVVYLWTVRTTRPSARPGLLLPVVIVGGSLFGAAVANIGGFAGPQAWLDWQFLTSPHSGNASNAGLYPAIGGSLLLMVTVALLSFPLGVGAAVYLEEYAPDNRFVRLIDVNISNLAGVPSVVYGLLGLGVFVTYLGRPPGTVLIGGATLALLILPIVIISAREAIRSVPDALREASYGMGATRWQTQKNIVLPRAFPGILTGTILALGRAIGETAPLIMIGAPNVLFSLPTDLSSKVSAMPLQVYAWASLFASEAFYTRAVPAGVVVLVGTLLAMNSLAIVLRNRYQREQ